MKRAITTLGFLGGIGAVIVPLFVILWSDMVIEEWWLAILAAGVTSWLIALRAETRFGRIALVALAGAGTSLVINPWLTLGAIFAGMLLGYLLQYALLTQRYRYASPLPDPIAYIIFEILKYVGPHVVGVGSYIVLRGQHPIDLLSATDLIAVAGYVLTFTITFAIFEQLERQLGGSESLPLDSHFGRYVFRWAFLPVVSAVVIASFVAQYGELGHAIALVLMIAGTFMLNRNTIDYWALQGHFDQLVSLNNISRALRTSLELDALLEMIYVQVAHLLNAKNFYVALYDPASDRVTFPYAVKNGNRMQWEPRSSATRLTDQVIRSGSALLLNGNVRSYLEENGMDVGKAYPEAWIGVPLSVSGRTIGCLSIFANKPGERLGETAPEVLTTIATQAATAVENAQLYGEMQRQAERMGRLNEISTLMSTSLNPEQVLEMVCDGVLQVANASKVAIFLHSQKRQELYMARAEGLSDDYMAESIILPLNQTERVQPFLTGQTQLVEDLAEIEISDDYRELLARDGVRAMAELPLIAQGSSIGVMVAYYDAPHQFSQMDVDLLETFSSQTGIAVANARDYVRTDQALARRVEQLQALETIGREIVSTLHLDKVADTVLVRAMGASAAACGVLLLNSEESGTLRLVAQYGLLPDAVAQFAPNNRLQAGFGIIGRAFRTGEYSLVANRTDFADLTRGQIKSELAIPITAKGEVYGVIALGSPQRNGFNPDDIHFVSQLALQSAVAIVNSNLYQSANDRLAEQTWLYESGRAIAETFSKTQILRTISERIVTALDATGCAIYEYDARSQSVEVVYQQGLPDAMFADRQTLDLVQQPLLQAAVDRHEPLVEQIRFLNGNHGRNGQVNGNGNRNGTGGKSETAALLTLPLVSSERVTGLITVVDKLRDRFTTQEQQLLMTLATQAAVSIENARLFEQIREGRDQMAAVLSSTSEGIMMIDIDGVVALVNPEIEALWGIESSHLSGKKLTAINKALGGQIAQKLGYPESDLRNIVGDVCAAAGEDAVERHTYHINTPTPRFIERTVSPVLDVNNDSLGCLFVLRDVTEEKQLEQARDDLSSMIVHDLRSPLAGISGSLRLLEDYIPEDGKSPIVDQALNVADRSSKRLLGLVDSLLDVAKLSAGEVVLEVEAEDLNGLVERVVLEMQSQANDYNVVLMSDVRDPGPIANIDANKIERVIINLLDNALKFTPEEHSIIVKVSDYDESDPKNDEVVTISVLDEGPGIPDDYRERIFDRFQQVVGSKGRRRGTGLGLSFCKLAVEAHDGKIWVENRPEKGSAFCFTLPKTNVDFLDIA